MSAAFAEVFSEKLQGDNATCTGDACDVSYTLRRGDVAKDKLRRWMDGMHPMDYDAPGTTARESGV